MKTLLKDKKTISLLFSILIVSSLIWMYMFTGTPRSTTQKQPIEGSVSLSGQTINKKELTLDHYKNKVIIIDFWATWCPPCVAEIPHFTELQSKYGTKGLQIIGVSLDQSIELIPPFVEEKGVNYPIVLGLSLQENGLSEVSSIPTTFILDRNHKLIQTVVGYRSLEFFEEIITPLL
jgi:thiol-disulfide isomerase/thioredoxin